MKNVRIGYARVSTEDQNLDMQIRALEAAGCDPIFSDKLSGKSMKRPGLHNAVRHAVAGDTLVVWKLDRLGRSIKGVIETVELMHSRGIELVSLTEHLDTKTAIGRCFFHIIASLAEMERGLISERTQAGLRAKMEREGWSPGRPEKMTEARVARLRELRDTRPRLKFQAIVDALNGPEFGDQIAATTIRNWERRERLAEYGEPEEFDDK